MAKMSFLTFVVLVLNITLLVSLTWHWFFGDQEMVPLIAMQVILWVVVGVILAARSLYLRRAKGKE